MSNSILPLIRVRQEADFEAILWYTIANRLQANSCQTGGVYCLLKSAIHPALFCSTSQYTRCVHISASGFPINSYDDALRLPILMW